ncbi:hypothetical protein Lfu02_00610 [Longispora fulva]|uniref:Uncharacterized protein n=1 Tax=Longispora fulva TaxID=619741 RepID=A0A8J7G980_9ACTN|nr:hypothetical protein [Longispora fulva]MBG6136068.1 hypothetical protein [Longispora fulva]GIG55689.1 hypothetical protein Lfu02_00610 [Longispora fulva]
MHDNAGAWRAAPLTAYVFFAGCVYPLWLDIDFVAGRARARWTAEQPAVSADELTVAQAVEIDAGYVQMMTAGSWSAPS